MTSFKIPESAYAAIQHLIHLSEPDFELFLDALSKAEPSLNKEMFWSHVTKYAQIIDKSVIKSIVHEIFDMDDARTGEGLEEFAEQMAEAATEVNSKNFPFEAGDKKTLKDRLVKIFEGRKGLEITMKSLGVALNQQHIYYHSQIVTDLRPVFNKNGNSVDAAVIVHNLRIHYGIDSEHRDFYVALDTSDIEALREVLDRADEKTKCLKGLLKASGVSYLDVEK